MPDRPQQGRAAACADAGDLNVPPGAHLRVDPRRAAVPRLGPEPGDRRHRLVELDLHGGRRRSPASCWRACPRRSPRPHLAGRLGAHRVLGRLPVGPRRRAANGAPAADPRSPNARRGLKLAGSGSVRPQRCSANKCRAVLYLEASTAAPCAAIQRGRCCAPLSGGGGADHHATALGRRLRDDRPPRRPRRHRHQDRQPYFLGDQRYALSASSPKAKTLSGGSAPYGSRSRSNRNRVAQ